MSRLCLGLMLVLMAGGLMAPLSPVLAVNETPSVATVSGVEEEVPGFVAASEVRVPLEALFRLYKEFDELYWKRQQGREKVSGTKWENMGKEFQVHTQRSFSLTRENDGHFILRAYLIEGECYLFAAIEYFRDGNTRKFLELYEKGITVLERVILIAEDDVDFLPRYSLMLLEGSGPTKVILNRWAGYETIGTGYRGGLGDPRLNDTPIYREVTYDARPYAGLEQYQFCVGSHLRGPSGRDPGEWNRFKQGREPLKEPYSPIRQIHTSSKAKELLSEFCPWGVQMYTLLKEVGLTKELDFRILRPFVDESSPKLSEFAIQERIPFNIREDMESIIGDGETGYVERAGRKSIILWDWVQERPTYTIWYISPSTYDMKPSGLLSWALRALKLFFGGPLDLVVDETLSYLVELVGKGYGKDGDIHGVSSLVVDGNNYGLDSDFLIEREEFNILKVGKELAKASFKYLEELEIKWLYDGIDPEILRTGFTYSGNRIPPILIRGEVYGYEKVPDYRYRKTRRIIRYYQLNPGPIAYGDADIRYDLSEGPIVPLRGRGDYLSEKEIVHERSWPRLPNSPKPLGSREVLTDFTPLSQILKITLDEDNFEEWSKTRPGESEVVIKAELYSPPIDDEPVMSLRIEQPEVTLQLFSSDYRRWNETERFVEVGVAVMPVSFLDEISLGLSLENTKFLTLTSEYTLTITRNGERAKEIPLNLVGRPEKPLTGTITSPKPGVVEFTLIPERPAKNRFAGLWRGELTMISPKQPPQPASLSIEELGEGTIEVFLPNFGMRVPFQLDGNVARLPSGFKPEDWGWAEMDFTLILEEDELSVKFYASDSPADSGEEREPTVLEWKAHLKRVE